MLEGALRRVEDDVEETELLEESFADETVDELELDSVLPGSGVSMVTVGELTSMIE